MNKASVIAASGQFTHGGKIIYSEPLGNGLIHHTYKIITDDPIESILLQAINTNVFKDPSVIVRNYEKIYACLASDPSGINIAAPLSSKTGSLIWVDQDQNNWRATSFIDNSYSPMTADTSDAARTVAHCFSSFTAALAVLKEDDLEDSIRGFHDLNWRYTQFERAIESASIERLLKSTHVIAELRQRKSLVEFYQSILLSPEYPSRPMHHDCKISNILFDETSHEVICPVDLDTVMPGKFFSDLGDMIRSMACTVDENSTQWEQIAVRPAFYQALLKGYMGGIKNILSDAEEENIHYSGLIMIYMQALRFTADFLHGDVYYKTNYPEQNLNRALNQLILLERLEDFLRTAFSFSPY